MSSNLNTARSQFISHDQPRLVHRHAMLIAGLRRGYSPETCEEIPALWESVAPHLGRIAGQVDRNAYGICFGPKEADGCFDYLAGVEVSAGAALPNGWTQVTIPAQRYAVFTHDDHVSKLKKTVGEIFEHWLPESGERIAEGIDSPKFFERYTETFNPHTGRGGMEIWVPLK